MVSPRTLTVPVSALALALAVTALACGTPPQPPVPSPSPAAKVAVVIVPSAVSSSPPAPAPSPASPFKVLFTDAAEIAAFPFAKDTLLFTTSEAPLAVCTGAVSPDSACTDLRPLVVDAGAPPTVSSVPPPHRWRNTVVTMGGVWPTSAWMGVARSAGEESVMELYTWKSAAWERVRKTDGPWIARVQQLVLVDDATVLGLAMMRPDPEGAAFARVAHQTWPGDRIVAIAGPARFLPKLQEKTQMFTLHAMPDGTLRGLGQRVKDNSAATFVQHWGRNGVLVRSDVLPLPDRCDGGEINAQLLQGRDPDGVVVAGTVSCGTETRAYIAQGNGSGFAVVDPPEPTENKRRAELTALAAPSANQLWIVLDGALLQKRVGAPWTRVPMPTLTGDACVPEGVWARVTGDVFVTAACSTPAQPKQHAVLRGAFP